MQEMSLDKAAEVVYRKLKSVAGNPASLPETLRPIAVLYTVQAMIDNGGFQYLFESDFPFNPSYAAFSDAYRTIGAADIADRLDRAVSLFPFSNPEFDREARNTFMDSLNEASEFPSGRCGVW